MSSHYCPLALAAWIGATTGAPTPTPPPPVPPYATVLQAALEARAPGFCQAHGRELRSSLKGAEPTVIEAEIGATGEVVLERLTLSSGSNPLDDLWRQFLLAVEPFAAPPSAELGTRAAIPCLVRIVAGGPKKRPKAVLTVACQPKKKPLFQVSRLPDPVRSAKDAAARLLVGWTEEAAGNLAAAQRHYRQATNRAPNWDLAARAYGLSLVKAGKVGRAIPFLNIYAEARRGAADALEYAREIDRYQKLVAARLAEQNRVRDRLSKEDIAQGIRKGYPLLEPCLKRARKQRLLAPRLDTLVLSWRIRKNGTVSAAHLEGPSNLLMTDAADCVERTVKKWQFPRYRAGSEITATRVPLKVKGSPPAPVASAGHPTSAPKPAQPAELDNEPSFSQCERSANEINRYIRKHHPRLVACINGERERAPAVKLPEQLPVGFVIDTSGQIRGITIDHRAYHTGPLATCVEKALAGNLFPSDGADCPAEFALDLSRLAPPRRQSR